MGVTSHPSHPPLDPPLCLYETEDCDPEYKERADERDRAVDLR